MDKDAGGKGTFDKGTFDKSKEIAVEVIYALPEEQQLLLVMVSAESIVSDVIEKSGVLEMYPELVSILRDKKLKVGLFGKLTKLDQKVRDKDRIEIYRPLIADPKEVRRKRAAEGKRLKKGGSK